MTDNAFPRSPISLLELPFSEVVSPGGAALPKDPGGRGRWIAHLSSSVFPRSLCQEATQIPEGKVGNGVEEL